MNKTFGITSVKKSDNENNKDMELINRYSKRPLKRDEVYIFSLILCDNEIDRDFEQFSENSLITLAEMFKGKSGIFDHNPKAENQSARVFDTSVIEHSDRKNSVGETYFTLNAKAYIPVTEKTRSLIEEIETGIKKEVSISCSVSEKICSICGCDMRSAKCSHTPGEIYDGKKCFGILKNPTDAYEWSFVAVPAQPAAGVIKAFKDKEEKVKVNDIKEKIFSAKGSITISEKESAALKKEFEHLEKLSLWGEEYKRALTEDTVKLCAVTVPELLPDTVRSICASMEPGELKQFKSAFETRAKKKMPISPQLAPIENDEKLKSNNQFKI